MSTRAKFVTEITVIDPDTKMKIELAVYKHENGGMFAIDSSFVEQVAPNDELLEMQGDDITCMIMDPFSYGNPETLYLKEV